MAPSSGDVTGTDFIFLTTDDFEAARAFYTKVVGLEQSASYGKFPGGEFQTGNVSISILQADAIGREHRAGSGAIALRVDDVAAARSRLEEKGVEFVGDTIDSGVCLQAIFTDPDGNSLILHNRYAAKDGAAPADG